MANDPGLSNDTCIFVEAITGDGGTHDPNNVWWLSPDISLVGPVSGMDSGDAGQINPITVKIHRKPATSNCTFPGDESLNVEVWVANPSLAMSPGIHGSATRVGFLGSPLPAEGATASQQLDWNAPRAPAPGDPQSPGPKCLVARAYPSSGIPNTASFFVPGDQHVAQRNLCVIASSSNTLTFSVNSFGSGNTPAIINPPPNAKLRAVLDLNPSAFVRNAVLNRLQAHTDFPHIRTTPLPFGFKFDLTNLHASDVVDHSHPLTLPPLPPHTNPSFEAKVVLNTHQLTPLTFMASLKGMAAGEACIFHLIQTSVTNTAQGGLTLIALRT
jgi:hypothetical protein